MKGLLIGIFIYCIAIYIELFWVLGNIKAKLKEINQLLRKVADKEEEG